MFAFVFMCCLEFRRSLFDPSTLIDMLRVKTSGYDSQRTTRRSPLEDPNLGQGGYPRPRAGHDLDLSYTTFSQNSPQCAKNNFRTNSEGAPRHAVNSQIRLCHFYVNFDMSKSPNSCWGVLVTQGKFYYLILVPFKIISQDKTQTTIKDSNSQCSLLFKKPQNLH